MAGADEFGQPTWADSDPVNLAVDLTEAARSTEHGPYRRGTAAERAAAAPIYDGLTWWQTDGTRGLWVVRDGAWVPPRVSVSGAVSPGTATLEFVRAGDVVHCRFFWSSTGASTMVAGRVMTLPPMADSGAFRAVSGRNVPFSGGVAFGRFGEVRLSLHPDLSSFTIEQDWEPSAAWNVSAEFSFLAR